MRLMPHLRTRLALGCCMLAWACPSAAFDPNAGAESISATPNYETPVRRLPANIVPGRYYTTRTAPVANAAPVAQPAVIAPPPVATAPVSPPAYAAPSPPAAGTMAPLPEPRQVPAEQPVAYGTIASPAPQPVPYAAPAPAPQENFPMAQSSANYRAMLSDSNLDRDRFSIGIEGYYDEYRENIVDLKVNGPFGSVTGSYEHYFSPSYYGAVEIRGSRGQSDYESVSGTIDNINEWEAESRLLLGYDKRYSSGESIRVYAGSGTRFFYDDLKGKIASGGSFGYDRVIWQLYIPIGVTYEFQAYGFNFAPNVEIDPLIYGNVQSRLQNISGGEEINNRQKSGIGVRAEFMMGQRYPNGMGWQFGPFLRYWNIPNSEFDTNGAFAPGVGAMGS